MIFRKRLFRYGVLITVQLLFILLSHLIMTISHHVLGLEDRTVSLMGDIFKLMLFVINLWWGFLAAEEFKWYNIVFSLISGSLFVTIIMVVPVSEKYGNIVGIIIASCSQIIYWELLRLLKLFTFKKPLKEEEIKN